MTLRSDVPLYGASHRPECLPIASLQANKPIQPTPLRSDKIEAILAARSSNNADLIYRYGAADGQSVGPLSSFQFVQHHMNMIDPFIGWVSGQPRFRKLTTDERATLIQHLTHRKSRLRWMAADLLGKQCALEGVDPLMETLHDSQWLVRLHAAKALGRIGDARAFGALSAALSDDHTSVRRHVIRALGRLPDERAITELLRVVQQEPALRNDVASSLTNFVTPRAANALMQATTSRAYTIKSGRAVWFGQLFTPILLRLLDSMGEVWQYQSIKLLGQIGDQRAIPALEKRSIDTRSRVQQAAYIALAQVQYRTYQHLIPH